MKRTCFSFVLTSAFLIAACGSSGSDDGTSSGGSAGTAGTGGGSGGMAGRPVTPEVTVFGSVEGCVQDTGGQLSFTTDASAVTGTPVAGATVAIEGTDLSATTGADGCFIIDDVPAGLASLTVDGSNNTPLTVIGEATINVGNTTVTRSEAVVAAESELAARGYPSVTSTWLLATQQPVPSGVTVHDGIFRLGDDGAPALTTVSAPSWFVYLDPYPSSYFSHPTLFALIDAETGDVTSIDTGSWPQLNGLLYYAYELDNVTSPDLITGPPMARRHVPRSPARIGTIQQAQTGTTYGLVIQGDARNDFEIDADNMEQRITDNNGFVQTFRPDPQNRRGTFDAPRDIEGLLAVLNDSMTANDKFVVSFHTHGLPNGDMTLEQGVPEDGNQPTKARYTADQFPWDRVNANNITIVIDTCHAEAVAEPLKELFKDPKFQNKKITVIAGTCANEVGGAGVVNAGDRPGGYVTNAVLDQLGSNFCPENVVAEFNDIAAQATRVSIEGMHIGDHELAAQMDGNKGIGVHPKLLTFNMPQDCSNTEEKVSSASTVGSNLELATFASAISYRGAIFPTIGSSNVMGTAVPWGSSLTCGHGAFASNFGPSITGPQFNNSTYPCGMGTEGLTLCENTGPVPDGDYIVVVNVLSEAVPLNDPTNFWTYGFVFDSDGVAANNFQPIPQFPNDFFQDTDRWYQAQYNPSSGWSLRVTDAALDPNGTVTSNARLIITANALVLVVPASEFSVPRPAYRLTNFRHTGDFGQNPPFDWDGDVSPPVSEGLITW